MHSLLVRLQISLYNNYYVQHSQPQLTFLITYRDATEIGLMQVLEDYFQKCSVVVSEIV